MPCMSANPLFLEWVTLLGASALAALIVLVVAVGLFHAWGEEKEILFGELLSRQGAAVLRAAYVPGTREFALAVRRCVNCAAQARCRSWLESGAAEGYEAFCPNTGYVARLKLLTG